MNVVDDKNLEVVEVEGPPDGLSILSVGKGEAERINKTVANAIVKMSTPSDGSCPVFSVFDIARESGIHPMLVAAAIRFNPKVKELSNLLAEATVSELLSRYLHYILSSEDEDGNITVNGRTFKRPSKDQVEAIRFFITNQTMVSPGSGNIDTETETSRLLGTKAEDEAVLDPSTMSQSQQLDYLKQAMSYMKARRGR